MVEPAATAALARAVSLARAWTSPAASYSADVHLVVFLVLAVGSFFVILAALLAGAVPATIVLDRIGIPALVRDFVLLVAGTGLAAWGVPRLVPDLGLRTSLAYGLVTSLLWILAVHWAARRRPGAGAGGPPQG